VSWIKCEWRNYVYLQLQKFTDKTLGGSQSPFLPQKCAKTHLHAFAISKIFPGFIRRTPVKMAEGGMGREVGMKGKGWEGEVACLTTYRSVVPPLLLENFLT
jgi:hypothetical protein